MPNSPARYARTTLGTTSATLYTIPAATTGIVTEIVITNTTAADIDATITLAGTRLLSDVAVPGSGILNVGIKQVMATGEVIAGFASATGLNVFISGVNVT